MKGNAVEEKNQLLRAISFSRETLLTGTVIAIDPSSGSRQSLPGFAIFKAGNLMQSGVIEVPLKLMRGINYTPHRLLYITKQFRERFPDQFDLLIMEGIHYKTNSKTNPASFQQLNQAVGALICAVDWKYILQIYPWHWKELVVGVYSKGDAMDAINIGMAAIQLARDEGATGATKVIEESVDRLVSKVKAPRKSKTRSKSGSKTKSSKVKRTTTGRTRD